MVDNPKRDVNPQYDSNDGWDASDICFALVTVALGGVLIAGGWIACEIFNN